MLIKLLDYNNKYLGIVLLDEALNKAKLCNRDLIKINVSNGFNVYKIGDYNKYIYKKKRVIVSKKIFKCKELYFDVNIDYHDYLIKLNKIILFNKNCNVVKIIIMTRSKLSNIQKSLLNFSKRILDDLSNKLTFTYSCVNAITRLVITLRFEKNVLLKG